MITIGEHLERILSSTPLLELEEVPLAEARDRSLAREVVAEIPVPPWTNSAMDGYALRQAELTGASEEHPAILRVEADIPAGSADDPSIGPGGAVRIMTGAPVPTDADTVIPQELTDCGTDEVRIHEALPRGRHIRRAGEDREVGERIAPQGATLTPEMLAAIASAGVGTVSVRRRPSAVVISTGDELVPAGVSLKRGQIPDSNSLLMSMIAEDAGALVTTTHAGDSEGDLARVIEEHRHGVDLIIITGGVSVGAFDPVKSLFRGDDSVRFDRVAMQPGKPQAFGRLGESGPLLFGLPGNPVSAWVSFQMFARPSLRKMQGSATVAPTPVPGIASEGWKTPKGRTQVIPVQIQDGERREVRPAAIGGSGSHLIASLAEANGYALVDAEVEAVRAGDEVLSVRLRDPEQFNFE